MLPILDPRLLTRPGITRRSADGRGDYASLRSNCLTVDSVARSKGSCSERGRKIESLCVLYCSAIYRTIDGRDPCGRVPDRSRKGLGAACDRWLLQMQRSTAVGAPRARPAVPEGEPSWRGQRVSAIVPSRVSQPGLSRRSRTALSISATGRQCSDSMLRHPGARSFKYSGALG
jgi:hypothetical protein